jgi:hypothetical protein
MSAAAVTRARDKVQDAYVLCIHDEMINGGFLSLFSFLVVQTMQAFSALPWIAWRL